MDAPVPLLKKALKKNEFGRVSLTLTVYLSIAVALASLALASPTPE
jgi:hypothetical protein